MGNGPQDSNIHLVQVSEERMEEMAEKQHLKQ